MGARVIIVGDIHGCLEELHALLDQLRYDPADTLITVGDLVGKGPDGAGAVRFFREGGHAAVLGNHDDKLLRWRRGERDKPLKASHSAHAEAMNDADWNWLEALPLWISLPAHGTLVVHAGVVPGVPTEEQRRADLLGMRSLRTDGSSSPRAEDGEPWAARYRGPERIVFGHDAIRGLQRWPFALGLDTGCCYGGHLSALVLPDDRVVSQRAFRAHQPIETATRVCQISDLAAPRPVFAGHDSEGRPREVLVLATPDGEPRAYLNRCRHLPIPLDGGSREFLTDDGTHLRCGTHGAIYRLDDGYCVEGPCEGTWLERVPLRIDDEGFVVLDP